MAKLFLRLATLCLVSRGLARRVQRPILSASMMEMGESDEIEQTPNSATHTAVFQPGEIGLQYQETDGLVVSVDEGGNADKAGVKVGMRMLTIADMPYTYARLKVAREGNESYRVTYSTQVHAAPLNMQALDDEGLLEWSVETVFTALIDRMRAAVSSSTVLPISSGSSKTRPYSPIASSDFASSIPIFSSPRLIIFAALCYVIVGVFAVSCCCSRCKRRKREQFVHNGKIIYEWKQFENTMIMYVAIPEGVGSDDLHIEIEPRQITIGRKGMPSFIKEKLYLLVDDGQSSWKLDSVTHELEICFVKLEPTDWPGLLLPHARMSKPL